MTAQKKGTLTDTRCPSSTPTGLAAGLGSKKLTLRTLSSIRPLIGSPVVYAFGGKDYLIVDEHDSKR